MRDSNGNWAKLAKEIGLTTQQITMTELTILRHCATRIAQLEATINNLKSKNAKQRNEIGRLTHDCDRLFAEKRDVTFELNKARANVAQLIKQAGEAK